MTEDTPHADGRPPSFHYDYSDDWGTWVLEHGLAELPKILGEDDVVPIASWAGERLGAVLFRSWAARDETNELRFSGEERAVDDDHYSWIRTEAAWVPLGARGGSGGPLANPMAAPDIPADTAWIGGEWLQGDAQASVRGVVGTVGTTARYIELEDRHGQTRFPVDAPVGQIVVCFDPDEAVVIRVKDERGRVLTEARRQPDE